MQYSQVGFICPVCQSDKLSILGPYEAETEAFKKKELAKCSQCSAVSMYPSMLDCGSEEYYAKQYWTDEILQSRSPSLRAQATARCFFMKPGVSFGGNLRVLDVGAGIGYMNWGFRTVWPDAQTEYTAIEVNPAAVKYLRSDPGVNHVVRDFNEVHGQFDVIVLSHILEHITEPVNFLNTITGFLRKPNGCLFVEVPNLDFRFKKRNEPHVLFYSPDSLTSVLSRQGLEIIRVDTCGQPVWKKRSDGGMVKQNILLSLRKMSYKFMVRLNSEYSKYGGDRQWIRALCKMGNKNR